MSNLLSEPKLRKPSLGSLGMLLAMINDHISTGLVKMEILSILSSIQRNVNRWRRIRISTLFRSRFELFAVTYNVWQPVKWIPTCLRSDLLEVSFVGFTLPRTETASGLV
jgi:hypothetical protein